MTPLDIRHHKGFLNFRNKKKRLQQQYLRSLCGLASSQYECVYFVCKTIHIIEKRKREEKKQPVLLLLGLLTTP